MSTLLNFTAGVAKGAGGSTLSGGQIVDAVTSGAPVVMHVNLDTVLSLLFANRGNIAHRIIASQNITLAITGGISGQFQEMFVMVQLPANGGGIVTLSSDIIWVGPAPFIDARSGAVTFFRLWTLDGGNTIYGKSV